jgi:hypothetical protein
MGRPRVGKTVMTPAERQRRRRAKLREIVHAADVLADLERHYGRADLREQGAIRAGLKKLLARWEKVKRRAQSSARDHAPSAPA